ncbi:MAG: glycosyltransferase [Acidobacteriota bacterium]|nr:glycosyltransferase [Acidobacteriota bacterium]
MKCTVLLPVFNGAGTLAQAIDSILAQSEPDFELLIIDDNSSDRSPEIIRAYTRRDARVTAIFHETNLGLAPTLNEGLRRAQADLIVRMDQDDESLPQRIELQLAYMRDHAGVAVAGSHVYHMAKRRQGDRLVRVPVQHDDILSVLPSSNCFYHASVIFRKEAVLDAGGYNLAYKNAEDYDLWLRLSRKHRLANLDVPLLRYRFSTGGMTLGRKWEQLLYVQKAILSYSQPQLSPQENDNLAHQRREAIGKEYFFEQVARGTIEELARLGLWGDAFKIYARFAPHIGARRSARVLMHWMRCLPRSRRTG